MLAVMRVDPAQHIDEGRHAVTRCFWEIGSADERRLIVVRQKHRQWPTAGPPLQQLKGGLINLVEIGPLLAIHLDIDEQLVHHPSGGVVLEGFVRHDVAPVTSRITDG
jgi:hypothetical protein